VTRASRWLLAYFALLGVACLLLNRWVSVSRDAHAPRAVLLSVWQRGRRVARRVVPPEQANEQHNRLTQADRRVVAENLLDEGPVLGKTRLLFGASFVPNCDGIKIIFRDQVTYLTPDDLLQLHAYDFETDILGIPITLGVNRDIALSAAADELRILPHVLLTQGKFRRIAVETARSRTTSAQVDIPTLHNAVTAAANYLARQVTSEGTFRYEVDPYTEELSPGYSWPRHAGATWFLAQVANYLRDENLWQKASFTLNRLTTFASLRCGRRRCIGEGTRVDVGSSALTLLALCEIYSASLDSGLKPIIVELADFIRSQQRSDGEFAHTYDRAQSTAVDEQFPYYTGEAALALSRAHLVTHDSRDLDAATLALKYLVSRPALFVTWRYFWRAEHWTCQAVTDLWTRAPSKSGLEFCLAWQRYNRGATSRDPEYAGAAGRFLFRSVPLTGTASSTEAAVATLTLSRLAPIAASEVTELEQGVRRSLALLLRYQFTPGPEQLMKNPAVMHGGMPASTTDLRVRIDYPQHAGSAWLGYLRLLKKEL